MSEVKQAAEQAYATIVAELAGPYFFEKLAAQGITARSQQEAAEMWALASKLHVLYTDAQAKTAAAQVSGLTAANQQLDAVLAAAGRPSEKSASFDGYAEAAAARPHIANAVLTLQAAAAAALQNAQ